MTWLAILFTFSVGVIFGMFFIALAIASDDKKLDELKSYKAGWKRGYEAGRREKGKVSKDVQDNIKL